MNFDKNELKQDVIKQLYSNKHNFFYTLTTNISQFY